MPCKRCGSYAINHNLHGRDGSDPDLCDVCYWRKRAEEENEACAKVCEDRAGTMSMFATTRDAKTHNAAVKGDAAAIRARRNHG